jgi:hypothetical protein
MKLTGEIADKILESLAAILYPEDPLELRNTNIWLRPKDGGKAHRMTRCSRGDLIPNQFPITWGDELFISFACDAKTSGSMSMPRNALNGRIDKYLANPIVIQEPLTAKDDPCFTCLFTNRINDHYWPNPRWFREQSEFQLGIGNAKNKGKGYLSLGALQPIYWNFQRSNSILTLVDALRQEIGLEATLAVLPFVANSMDYSWEWKFKRDQAVITSLVGQPEKSESSCLNCESSFLIQTKDLFAGVDAAKRLLVNGLTLLCEKCLSLRAGTQYEDVHSSALALKALVDYNLEFGMIPTPDWIDTPLLMGTGGNFFDKADITNLVRRRLKLLSKMPNGAGNELNDRSTDSYWMALLGRAGLVQTSTRTGYGVTAIAQDGHFCRSLLEYEFCNFLFENDLPHETEPFYGDGTKRRADFVVGTTVIEIAGLMSVPSYRQKMKEKVDFAKSRRLKLAVLLPEDVRFLVRKRTQDMKSLEINLESFINRKDLFEY